jgi:acylphosphatase
MIKAKKIIFNGIVQGVCFRFTTERIIAQLKLVGTVENLDSKVDVKLVIQGEESEIEQAIKMVCLYFGKRHLKNVKVWNIPINTALKDFHVIYPAFVLSAYCGGQVFGSAHSTTTPPRTVCKLERCSVCGFETSFVCDVCKKPVCGFCRMNNVHLCDKVKSQQQGNYKAALFL